ncbi:hypothetical protein CORC01_10988 [Colletotrichum orchidophilum]|uniref:Uncharacterized protein n=1 Tax=Colletotrichum orchidophilum TaxID=1209926 RepID=A0A1G4AX15_9PEZI|nr:uncharacterized protein CORC01_10988 [Colletotrichum orchidophilum]OHE93671.1 hypothetical protein CORC01_10988 [Colletotrichum orchidophilum]
MTTRRGPLSCVSGLRSSSYTVHSTRRRPNTRFLDGFPFLRWVPCTYTLNSPTAARRILTRSIRMPGNGCSWRLRVETVVADDTSATASPLVSVPSHRYYGADLWRTWTLAVPWWPGPHPPLEVLVYSYSINLSILSDVSTTSGIGPALRQSMVFCLP